MERDQVDKLIDKYLAGTCTPEEREIVERAYQAHYVSPGDALDAEEVWAQRKAVWQQLPQPRAAVRRMRHWVRVAAAVLVVCAVGFWVYRSEWAATVPTEVAGEIGPGGNRATLTLANGHTIDLSTAQSGIVVGNEITYADGSEILTDSLENAQPDASSWLSLTTPRGGTYQVVLSDGTKVWLNAASTLKYPVTFDGAQRTVEIVGEGYFDIAQDPRKPFQVVSGEQTVEVLGTEFNVAAYPDEPIVRTTLVNGKVRVAVRSGQATVLKPGEQAEWSSEGLRTTTVDLEEAVDWKSGYFTFNETPIEVAMAKIARWYDVEVAYQDNLKGLYFGGSVSRKNPLSQTLKILESTGNMKFKIEGRRVVVMP